MDSTSPLAPSRDRPIAVLCSGQATLDHVFAVGDAALHPGHKHRAIEHRTVGGGIAANAAVAVARLGGRAVFLGCVGADEAGDAVVIELRREGVDCDFVRRVAGVATPVSAVLVERDGARTIVNHTPPDLFDRPTLAFADRRVRAVLDDGRWGAATATSLGWARAHGVPAVVDVDRVPDDPAHRELIFGQATHLVFGATGLAECTGVTDPVLALRAVSGWTSAFVAVTLGRRGVRWLDGEHVRSVDAFRVDAVDTTGAGDVFHGAFALGLAEAMQEPAALRFASAAAALACAGGGARAGAPDRASVQRLLATSRQAVHS